MPTELDALHWNAPLGAFQEFETQLDALQRTAPIWTEFSPLFPALSNALLDEAKKVRPLAQSLEAALEELKSTGSVAVVGRALYDFTRAFDRLLRLKKAWNDELKYLADHYPALVAAETVPAW